MSTSTTAVSPEVREATLFGRGEMVKATGIKPYPVYNYMGEASAAFDLTDSVYLRDIQNVLSAYTEKAGYLFSTALIVLAGSPMEAVQNGDTIDDLTDHSVGNVVGAKSGQEYQTIQRYGNQNARQGRRCVVISVIREQVKVEYKDSTGKDAVKFEYEYKAVRANGFRPKAAKTAK